MLKIKKKTLTGILTFTEAMFPGARVPHIITAITIVILTMTTFVFFKMIPSWSIEAPRDEDAIEQLSKVFLESGGNMRAVLKELFSSDFFRRSIDKKKVRSPSVDGQWGYPHTQPATRTGPQPL